MKRVFPLLFLLLSMLLLVGCLSTPGTAAPVATLAPTAAVAVAEPTTAPTLTEAPTSTALPANPAGPTARPTRTATSTHTPTPTNTATPTDTPTPTNTPTPTGTATFTPTPSPSPSPTLPAVTPLPRPNPAGGYLSQIRLVAYYGSPLGRALGILGNSYRPDMYRDLRQLTGYYQTLSDDGRVSVPTFHMVTTVADAFPGSDGDFSHHVDLGVIANWVDYANANGAAAIIDIQPGLADLGAEVARVQQFLYNPHVHLALDPEFMMEEGEVPGQQLGEITGEEINAVQAVLNEIGAAIGVNRVLIVHQFEDEMIVNKAAIQNYPFVELVIDADGFGGAGTKLVDYWQYSGEPGFEYGGIKLFYEWDRPLMSPEEIMSIRPWPAVVIYQ